MSIPSQCCARFDGGGEGRGAQDAVAQLVDLSARNTTAIRQDAVAENIKKTNNTVSRRLATGKKEDFIVNGGNE